MGLFQKPPTGYFFLFYILIYIFECETIFRSSTSSFGHSDPDPSSVGCSGTLAILHTHMGACAEIPGY
jgi:hypothetical protein